MGGKTKHKQVHLLAIIALTINTSSQPLPFYGETNYFDHFLYYSKSFFIMFLFTFRKI